MKRLILDEHTIIKQYTTEHLFVHEICELLSVSRTAILNVLKRNNVQLRTKIENYKIRKPRKMSSEAKEKISKALTLAHKEHRHPGWNSVNNKTESSYPETFFYNLIKNDSFYLEYTIIEKLQFSRYTLDFAIKELKIDIEIDGQFHFNDDKTIIKDKQRDEYLLSNNWRVFRVAWTDLKENPLKINNKLKEFIFNADIELERHYSTLNLLSDKEIHKLQIVANRKTKEEKEIAFKEANMPLLEKLLSSDIDFMKFGWVTKSALLLGKHPQKINSWIKRMCPELLSKSHQRKCQMRESNSQQ